MTSEVEGVVLPRELTREMWAACGNAVSALIQKGHLHHDKLTEAVWEALAPFGTPTRVFAALRAQAERVRVLEGERDEARGVVRETLWMARRYADGRQTYAVGMFNDAAMLAVAGGYASGEPDGTIFARDGSAPEYRSAEARAEAAERRAGELEGALSALIVHFEGDELHDEGAFDIECPDCVALEAARALLPATQAENPQEPADE